MGAACHALILLVAFSAPAACAPILTPANVTINWLPSGHLAAVLPDAASPVFRFQVGATPPAARGVSWTAVTVQVCATPDCTAPLCSSTVPSSSATAATCAGAYAHAPNQLLFARVQVQGAGGAWSNFSAPSSFGTGLGSGASARWVSAPRSLTANASSPVRLRAELKPPAGATRAVLYLAAPGFYKLSSNGVPISTHEYGPATEFTQRVLYTAHDLTPLLSSGQPLLALGLRLGGGFWGHAPAWSATSLPFHSELHWDTPSGPSVTAALPWTAGLDSLSFSDWYMGEVSSGAAEAALARFDTPGWQPQPPWVPVEPNASPVLAQAQLYPHAQPPIATHTTLAPVSLTKVALPNRLNRTCYVFAFPVNLAGAPVLTVPSPASAAGAEIELYAGELLFPDGSVFNQLNGSTLQSLRHTLAGGGGVEVLRPTFAFWGFQYLAVLGWPAQAPEPTLGSCQAWAMATEGEQSGFLTFAGVTPTPAIAHAHVPPSRAGLLQPTPPLLTRPQDLAAQELARPTAVNASTLAAVQSMTLWGTRGNWFSVPSDCPTREKRGWMGDGASSVGQAARNFFWPGAYASWLRSMRDDQLLAPRVGTPKEGVLSVFVPRDNGVGTTTDASWALAAGEVLAQVMSVYGVEDQQLAAASTTLDSLLAFFRREVDAGGVMRSQALFGDWCANFDRVAYVNATKEVCATASHMLLLSTGAAVATLLNKSALSRDYLALRSATAAPFVSAYSAQGQGTQWTDGQEQTPAVMPLLLDFFPSGAARAATSAWLVHNIEAVQGGHWSTGSVGTRFILQELDAMGRSDLAALLAAQDTYPSPGWWVTQGATTGWECWSGVADDTHPPPPTHNHPFLLAHGLWVWEGLQGLRIEEGGRSIGFYPPLLTDLPSASAAWGGPLGLVQSSWAWAGAPAASGARLALVLPPGTVAASVLVPLPGWGAATGVVREGGTAVWRGGAFIPGAVEGIVGAEAAAGGGGVVLTLSGSGAFAFTGEGPAGQSAPQRHAACAPWAPAHSVNVSCATAQRSPSVLRAGLFPSSERAVAFVERGVGLVGGAASLRFTVTHALQALAGAGGWEGGGVGRALVEAWLRQQGVALTALPSVHRVLCVEWLCPA